MRPGFAQGFRQLALAPALFLRRAQLDPLHRRMPAAVQGLDQLMLTQGQQAQHAVIHRQFPLPLELAQQA
ncbi:hypothetical protein D3C80_1247750 [compost metagenome]